MEYEETPKSKRARHHQLLWDSSPRNPTTIGGGPLARRNRRGDGWSTRRPRNPSARFSTGVGEDILLGSKVQNLFIILGAEGRK